MSVRLIVDPAGGLYSVALFDSISGFAFGPVFSSEDDAQSFLDSLTEDARTYSHGELERLYGVWVDSRDEVAS